MKTVLVALDFSPVTRAVLKAAIELARALHARVVLLNVVQPPTIVTDLAPLVGDVLQFTAEIERGSRRHLQQIQKRLAGDGAEVESICVQGFASATIVAHAKKLSADFIVLGSHGHTAFYDLITGSTASGVLKRATCPVVVVPAAPSKPKRRNTRRK
jgi:universal stress protein A